MKIIFLILLFGFSFSISVRGQTEFEKGFNVGYKKGYCYQEFNCLPPLPPLPPLPNLNESSNNWNDGYNRGFLMGNQDKKNGSSSNSNNLYTPHQYFPDTYQPKQSQINDNTGDNILEIIKLIKERKAQRNAENQTSDQSNSKSYCYKVLMINNKNHKNTEGLGIIKDNEIIEVVIDERSNLRLKVNSTSSIVDSKCDITLRLPNGQISDTLNVFLLK